MFKRPSKNFSSDYIYIIAHVVSEKAAQVDRRASSHMDRAHSCCVVSKFTPYLWLWFWSFLPEALNQKGNPLKVDVEPKLYRHKFPQAARTWQSLRRRKAAPLMSPPSLPLFADSLGQIPEDRNPIKSSLWPTKIPSYQQERLTEAQGTSWWNSWLLSDNCQLEAAFQWKFEY